MRQPSQQFLLSWSRRSVCNGPTAVSQPRARVLTCSCPKDRSKPDSLLGYEMDMMHIVQEHQHLPPR
ncbi:hypothetical protein AAFF_G00296310 [Aldrovandia affinis]|uniref:Uncharacterized protein n=1 Tax=Aldrovandia affinis TaxID=143900 RepID=A0AAD7SQ43_9TELE|nr:hypothetical protein AAFF_G00296310 [Aldrovandia affinis]